MYFTRISRPKLALVVLVGVALFLGYNVYRSYWTEYRARLRFLALIPRGLPHMPLIDENICLCPSNRTPTHQAQKHSANESSVQNDHSTCDPLSTSRGTHQKVISFSFYGNVSEEYFSGISKNAAKTAERYPGWVMRVYHSVDTLLDSNQKMLCQLWCNYPNLDFCQVGRLPPPLGDQSHINGMVWRFFPLGDALVDRFIVRDLDSVPTPREVAAVNQWIQSNRTWHFMHDHFWHNIPILGGMWGAVNTDLNLTTSLREKMIHDAGHYLKGSDQTLLEKYLYPVAKRSGDYIDHNSYSCGQFLEGTPWPTQRDPNLDFVGAAKLFSEPCPERVTELCADRVTEPCPEKCRPADHPEWIYC